MPNSSDETIKEFLPHLAEFKKDINDNLLFGQNRKSKYRELFKTENSDTIVMVFIQVNTFNLVRIIINCGFRSKNKPIDIFANDETLNKTLDELNSAKNISEALTKLREINDGERIMSKLKFGI